MFGFAALFLYWVSTVFSGGEAISARASLAPQGEADQASGQTPLKTFSGRLCDLRGAGETFHHQTLQAPLAELSACSGLKPFSSNESRGAVVAMRKLPPVVQGRGQFLWKLWIALECSFAALEPTIQLGAGSLWTVASFAPPAEPFTPEAWQRQGQARCWQRPAQGQAQRRNRRATSGQGSAYHSESPWRSDCSGYNSTEAFYGQQCYGLTGTTAAGHVGAVALGQQRFHPGRNAQPAGQAAGGDHSTLRQGPPPRSHGASVGLQRAGQDPEPTDAVPRPVGYVHGCSDQAPHHTDGGAGTSPRGVHDQRDTVDGHAQKSKSRAREALSLGEGRAGDGGRQDERQRGDGGPSNRGRAATADGTTAATRRPRKAAATASGHPRVCSPPGCRGTPRRLKNAKAKSGTGGLDHRRASRAQRQRRSQQQGQRAEQKEAPCLGPLTSPFGGCGPDPARLADKAMSLAHSVRDEHNFVSDLFAGWLGVNAAFEVALADLDVQHTYACDPRLDVTAADLVTTFWGEVETGTLTTSEPVIAMRLDGRPLQQACLLTARLGVERGTQGEAGPAQNMSESCTNLYHSRGSRACTGKLVRGSMHMHRHPLPFQVTFSDQNIIYRNLGRRAFSTCIPRAPCKPVFPPLTPFPGTGHLFDTLSQQLRPLASTAPVLQVQGSHRPGPSQDPIDAPSQQLWSLANAAPAPQVPASPRTRSFSGPVDALSQQLRSLAGAAQVLQVAGCHRSGSFHGLVDAHPQQLWSLANTALAPLVSAGHGIGSSTSPVVALSQQSRSLASTAPVLQVADSRMSGSFQNPVDAQSQHAQPVACTAHTPPAVPNEQLPIDAESVPCHLGWPCLRGPITGPTDPPALLGKLGPPRPSHISKLGLARIDLIPAHLLQYPVVEIPVDQLGLFALDPGKPRQVMRFSVFDPDRHHVHRTASQEWSLADLVSEAIRSYGEPVRAAQVLEQQMPGVASPQIVLTPQSARPNELCVPIDMRPFGGRPCTMLLQAGAQAADVIRAALQACPRGPAFLPPFHDERGLYFLDARGQVWHELPHDLSQLQWLRVSSAGPLDVLTAEEDFVAQGALPSAGPTTATSTWVGHSVVEHVSFVLTGMGITLRLHPQHVSQVRIIDSVADLTMALARQRAMPPRARLVLTAGQPHPQTRRHVTILLLLYPEDHRRHVVLDPSSDGSMAQSISVDARTCPEELVAAAQAREGYVAFVNGCPQAASRRVLYNGDYTQVVRMPAQHRVAPTDWFYELFPELRLLAFPIVIPRLERATANPLEPMVQTVVRDAFVRYLRQRFEERTQAVGQPAADTQAVIVQGAAHTPALLYVPGRICPVLSEVEDALRATGLFAEGTTFADSCHLTHQHAPLFLSIPPGMQNLGIFFPVPTFWMGYHLMWLPPGSNIGAFTLPTRRGFVLYAPPEMRQAAAATTRSAAAPPPERLARGTSLVQLPDESARLQRRCLALREAHARPDCACEHGKLTCPTTDDRPTEACREGQITPVTAIPTPFGRRRIPDTSGAAAGFATAPAPQPLCLEQLLPLDRPTQPEAALRFPLPADIEGHAFEAFDLGHLQPDVPATVPLMPVAASFLAALPRAGSATTCDALMLFVDGSYRDRCSAWSVVVLGRGYGQWNWLGFRAGRVPTACSGTSAFEAELWAQLVALGIVARAGLPAVIFYDSQSAALVAHGATAGASSNPLQATVASLACYVRCSGQHIGFSYVPSHQGNPGNELADGLAKYFLALPESQDALSRSLVPDVLANNYKWLWLRKAAETMPQWPALDADGCSMPCHYVRPAAPRACPQPCYGDLPTPPAPPQPTPMQALFLTYNTLSCKANLQRRCLQQFMCSRGAAVLALQETRQAAPPLSVVDGTIRLASAPLDGQLGCQLWLRAAGALTFDRHKLSIACSEPRLLIVLAHTALCRIAFVVAHAPTSTAPPAERDAWWDHLDARLAGLPPSAVPVLCCDANARFSLQAGREIPANANAHRLQETIAKYELCRTSSYAPDGSLHLTWRSPQGCPACLDYVLIPRAWESGLRTVSGLGLLDMHAGIDHEVLGAELRLQLHAPARREAGLDRDSMMTPWGRQAVARLFADAPLYPWSTNSDDHLQGLHAYLLQGAQTLFPRRRAGPRRPVLSQHTWHLLHLRRWARRVFRRRQQWFNREQLWAIFRGWRGLCRQGSALLGAGSAKVFDQRAAHYVRFMQQLTASLRASTASDEARFTREHFTKARQDGPRAMAAAIRAVLKHGRRYKPPLPATILHTSSGDTLTEEADVKAAFGKHFAVSERATACPFAQLAEVDDDGVPASIIVDALPSVVDLSSAFASMKCGKTPGPTLLPAELFKAAPLEAALSIMPVLLKSQARQRFPLLWRGVHSIALLKPNKPPCRVDSHRAIALMSTTGKAVAKACRPVLAKNFETITLPSVGGSRKSVPIELPSLLVQAYLSHLESAKLNGAVLFLDGVAAFPSTDRSLLFDLSDAQLQAKLHEASVEPAVARHFRQALRGQGALARARVPDDMVQFLNASLRGTWFSTDPQSATAYATTSGTLPGAPNADLAFQYAAQASLTALSAHLAKEDISASLTLPPDQKVHALPATWLDDLALLVSSPDAQQLPHRVARATCLAVQYLRLLGVETNFAAGKTEAVLHLCGKGSQQVQRDCLLGVDHGPCSGIAVALPDGKDIRLRCVSRYTHLGTIRTGGAEVAGDISRRLGLAREALKPVRARLLCNANFTEAEKRSFLFSLVLSRLLHNAGTWVFQTKGHSAAYRKGYVSLLRACVRPVLGYPCRRLTDQQVCAVLGAMLPQEAIACARIRVLAAITDRGHPFLQAVLMHERQWWNHALEDVRIVADVLRDPQLKTWTQQADRAAAFLAWPLSPQATANLLRRFRKAAVDGRQDLIAAAAAKAKAHDAADRAGVIYAVLPEVRAFDPECQCSVCHACFSTRAAAAAHLAKRHGLHAAAHFAVGTACQACMRQFWSTARLKQHLRSSRSCAGTYAGADLAEEVPVLDRGDQRLPPVSLIGPRPFWGSLRPPLAQQHPATADVSIQLPANHSRSSCVPLIVQHFRRLQATCGHERAVTILNAFAPQGEYGQLAKLAALMALRVPDGQWTARTEALTILAQDDQLAFGPHLAVRDFGPALFV